MGKEKTEFEEKFVSKTEKAKKRSPEFRAITRHSGLFWRRARDSNPRTPV